MKTPKTSMQQVAEICGVKVMTVTRALRPGASVAPATRAKIIKAVAELGYHPRPNQGRPRKRMAVPRGTAEVIMGTYLRSEFYAVLLRAIEQELAAGGLNCIIRTAGGETENFLALCETLREDRTVPTLLVGYLPTRQLATLLEIRPDAVLVDHTGDPELDVPYRSVGFDNVEAARQLTRHLLAIGRRRVLLVNGFAEHYFSRELKQGYREAMAEKGLPCDPALMLETDFSMEQAGQSIAAALDRNLDFDAVLTNDEMAAAVISTLARRGKRIPAEIAVAGCDGLAIGNFTAPPLTTAQLDCRQLGRTAVRCVFDARADRAPVRIKLLPKLIIRASTTTQEPS